MTPVVVVLLLATIAHGRYFSEDDRGPYKAIVMANDTQVNYDDSLTPAPEAEKMAKSEKNMRLLGSYKSLASESSDDEEDEDDYEQCELDAFPPKPDSQCCGVDSTVPDLIKGGNETLLGQYPWLVSIEYHDIQKNETVFLCGGSLISGRYVVTAAHCFKDKDYYKPVAVHVGGHYLNHKGPECVTSPVGSVKCTDGASRIPIQLIIKKKDQTLNKHKSKKESGSTREKAWNDIALIRLKENVKFTDYVRPICLSTYDIDNEENRGAMLFVAGWGATGTEPDQTSENVKRHVAVPLRDMADCRKDFSSYYTYNGVCAGGVTGKDSCKGDSGGPLMIEDDGQYYLVGVVSIGPTRYCGDNRPSIYANVYKYESWIDKIIRCFEARKKKQSWMYRYCNSYIGKRTLVNVL